MLSASSGRWVDKAVLSKSESTSGNPPEAHVFACGGIDAVGVGRGDESSHENNRQMYPLNNIMMFHSWRKAVGGLT
jgi:hypothetical protein